MLSPEVRRGRQRVYDHRYYVAHRAERLAYQRQYDAERKGMTTITKTRKPVLTADDLRREQHVSGFAQVQLHPDTGRTRRYRGRDRRANSLYIGPWRETPERAALDYISHINGETMGDQPAPRPNKHAHLGNRRRPLPDTPEVRAALDVLKRAREQAGQTGYVYLIGEPDRAYVYGYAALKIGYSTNPVSRLRELQTGNHRTLKLLAMREGTLAEERELQDRFIDQNLAEEWFAGSPLILNEFGLGAFGQ